ncbi:MAG: purine-nucleoside phosphorylase [Propionibacteriaceae bacterium]|jgi:purine-nucleoside phosphorylase|nr:purine-nucleoside phosphorylase [Propionibacteriaceae bacterium]
MTSQPPATADYPSAQAAARWLADAFGVDGADIGVVLGSGWSPAAEAWGTPLGTVPLRDVPGFRPPTAPGHEGVARHYRWDDQEVVVLAGRTHLYEGHGPEPVVYGVRTLAALGVTRLCLTNAGGTVHADWPLGTVAALTDHLNLTWTSPLVGPRFVDLARVYDPGLRAAARTLNPELREGVYAMFPGPHYETPAEVRAAAILGADMTGMSTVLEAIAAAEFAIPTLALSIVTAHSASGETIDPAEVVRLAETSARHYGGLIRQVLISPRTYARRMVSSIPSGEEVA